MAYSIASCTGLTAAGLIVTWTTMSFRLYVRHVMLHMLKWDDFLAFLTLV